MLCYLSSSIKKDLVPGAAADGWKSYKESQRLIISATYYSDDDDDNGLCPSLHLLFSLSIYIMMSSNKALFFSFLFFSLFTFFPFFLISITCLCVYVNVCPMLLPRKGRE